MEAEPPSSSTTATGQQRQIPLNTSISGSGFSHLGTPISATCSGKSGRGSGWPAQASRGPPGTISAGVLRTLQPPKTRGQRGFRRNRRHAQALLRRRREPGSRQRSSNSADARAETHWVFNGIIRGPEPMPGCCRPSSPPTRAAAQPLPALPEREMTEHLPVSTSRCEQTHPAPQRSRLQRSQAAR